MASPCDATSLEAAAPPTAVPAAPVSAGAGPLLFPKPAGVGLGPAPTAPAPPAPAPGSRATPPLRHLPLVTLYLTDRCNSRCTTCDYWRHGRTDISLESVRRLLPGLREAGTRIVLISGGEPLLHPDWESIAGLLRSQGMRVWLLTAGLALAKHARKVAGVFDDVTVSLDGTHAATYAAIRGLEAFDKVCEGIRAAADAGVPVRLRTTVQRANFEELPDFVPLAHRLQARQISFLAVDVANPHAFARQEAFSSDLALRPGDLPVLDRLLRDLERRHSEDFRAGFIAESPAKLRRLLQYFTAVCGQGPFPPVRCNAPEFSAVIGVNGQLQPCFFIPGPAAARTQGLDLLEKVNSPELLDLRDSIRLGKRRECVTCVCSLWREPGVGLRA